MAKLTGLVKLRKLQLEKTQIELGRLQSIQAKYLSEIEKELEKRKEEKVLLQQNELLSNDWSLYLKASKLREEGLLQKIKSLQPEIEKARICLQESFKNNKTLEILIEKKALEEGNKEQKKQQDFLDEIALRQKAVKP